jgi:tetratricopeptide (TPR) repeat protein
VRRALGSLAVFVLSACAPQAAAPPTTAARIVVEARAEGITLVDPLALDRDTLAEVDRVVPHLGTPALRLKALLAFLNDRGYVNFQYTPGRSLTAREAARERRGDCMAYAHLFAALSRRMGLPTYFVHVTEVRNYYERAGWFFVSSHVAVGHGEGPNTVVVDLTREINDWKLAFYEPIDDGAALALYYNNVAVDAMTAGRTAEAERLFRFFLDREPTVVELHNNLGVLLNRTGRHEEALNVLTRGIARFPTYEPLYTNAIRAARALGLAEVAAFHERRGQEISQGDPYFLFARALSLYEREKYALAARTFARAADAKPDSPVILAWLARAHLSAGEREKGVEAFTRAQRLSPNERILRELLQQYPELDAAGASDGARPDQGL